ncbi:MAG: 3-hydroxyacyl-CoA dehydrogenase family protein [Planctomycetaceae bacterium]|jgi:3-hydroxyacyl-CoA dehydrogenase|nr:3-hydroxyacyl-CoA dehydrogenase family protein [Planctomycetaceae bacterium]
MPDKEQIALQPVAVVGAGLMGTAVAAAHIRCSIPVVLYDTAETALAAAAQRIDEKLNCPFERQFLHCSSSLDEVKNCPVIIETIPEKLRLKQKLYRQITNGNSSGETLLLTNTSTISVTTLAETLEEDWQRRFCGFHFFHPVLERSIIELIPGKNTAAEAAEAAQQHALRIGKKPITVGDTPGFFVNRILHPYLAAALSLLEQGESWQKIERTATGFGMKKGPFQLIDEIGLDVVLHGGWVLYKAFPDRVKPSPLLLQLVESGNLGVKTGRGIRETSAQQKKPDTSLSENEIIRHLFGSMYSEAKRCLAEGVIASELDADTASVEALGFPQFRGGIISWGSKTLP